MKNNDNIEASANKVYIEDKCNVGKQSYNKKHINDDDKEQTHDMANRFRNRASLFVLATWTLGNHVAPDQEVMKVMMMMMTIMMMVMMMMTETYLIPLIGKNLPLSVSLLMFM